MTTNRPMGTGTMFWDDAGIRTTKIPIDLSSGSQVKIRVITVPCQPRDLLEVTGEVNMTNDTGPIGYGAGIATQLWLYDASTPPDEDRAATWRLLGQNGQNITRDLHHMQQGLTRVYVIPDEWVPGRSAGISLSCDAHSTAWNRNGGGEHITVEKQGCLIARRWRQEPA